MTLVPNRLPLPKSLSDLAEVVRGFMPRDEGEALCFWAAQALRSPVHLGVEIGSYCGLSTLYLAYAASLRGAKILSIDHHHGSEENGPDWPWFDPDLLGPESGRTDTLPRFRSTLEAAELEDTVAVLVADSAAAADLVRDGLEMVFIDGGHGKEVAWADYRAWSPKIAPGGILLIHDVFADPGQGGRPPFEIYSAALSSGLYRQVGEEGSLRALTRVANP